MKKKILTALVIVLVLAVLIANSIHLQRKIIFRPHS